MDFPDVSILMPTYNDSTSISTSINSVLSQKFENWELIIINDGSKDNTDEIVKSFQDSRIKYIKLDQNVGQLNALLSGSKHISGQYVTLLHSDDTFLSENSIQHSLKKLLESQVDGVYADLQIINEKGEYNGLFRTAKNSSIKTLANVFLLRGANLLSDIFFVKRDFFEKNVLYNYIHWNMPYWFFIDNGVHVAALSKIKPWYGYHLHSQNYILSDIGKFEVFNGMLRTTLTLSQFFSQLPGSRLPWMTEFLIKRYNLSLFSFSQYNGSYVDLVESVYMGIFGMDMHPDNLYLNSILQFYQKYLNNYTVDLPQSLIDGCNKWYKGSDSRSFFNDLADSSLDPYYIYLLEKSRNGFKCVSINNQNDYEKISDSLKFLNIKANIQVKN